MKNKTGYVLTEFNIGSVLFFIIPLLAVCSAQAQTVLNRFAVSENSGRVSLDWQIGAGNTCNGTIILHSIDSVEFNPIGEIVGICGSTTEQPSKKQNKLLPANVWWHGSFTNYFYSGN